VYSFTVHVICCLSLEPLSLSISQISLASAECGLELTKLLATALVWPAVCSQQYASKSHSSFTIVISARAIAATTTAVRVSWAVAATVVAAVAVVLVVADLEAKLKQCYKQCASQHSAAQPITVTMQLVARHSSSQHSMSAFAAFAAGGAAAAATAVAQPLEHCAPCMSPVAANPRDTALLCTVNILSLDRLDGLL
jgi:hypothetical protein